ncbi:MBL fold metallo-hydrolase [Cryobacterium sp. Hh11]|uniref:N-acyl homoserine lactonase family protein n=1 Tax=Cryobacterium sp. Hh11 TaxID=2555868 RepID=UPI00106D6258|nr:N-acyl homoserine lactonase family protein [Cryobacterium sp. Hh11]TFD48735.1 MBL fold metallo-hydrolase [Cryobacterium sp. Hh11]
MTDYSIWVLEYAYVNKYPKSGVLYGAHNQGTIKLPYCYVVLKSDDRTIMVDVGYNFKEYGKTLADKFGVVNWRDPTTVLSEVGVSPEEVTDVIITHAHFDHFGNVEDFPNARFHIQESEFSKWLWALTLPKQFNWLQVAIDPADLLRASELAVNGRLNLVDGDLDGLFPGIDLFLASDSHTFGSQFVRVNNSEGQDPWILAGDLRYTFENLTGYTGDGTYVPVGLASGSQLNLLLASERMMSLVGHEERRVIPIHEERLKDHFPARETKEGLQIVEVALAPGHDSRV